jgi:hypothetical protein|nr:hypothetical protein [uncultured Methanoregula sp.]
MAGYDSSTGANATAAVPLFLRVALLFLLICLNALIAKFVVFSFGAGPGTSLLYLVVAVMIVTTLWFGLWGAIATYAGCWIGAGVLSGLSPTTSLVWSVADLLQVAIPLLAFRLLGGDVSLRTRRDMGILIVFGIILNNLAGAIWGTLSLAPAGLVDLPNLLPLFPVWFIGNMIICAVIVPAVLWFGTPFIREHELFVKRYWI